MLILSRRNGESFYIGEDIKITVLSQRSNQVRIGIDAPRTLPVHREEVLARQKQQARRERKQQSEQTTTAEKAENAPSNQAQASKKAETEEL